jgi:hypothetical protein
VPEKLAIAEGVKLTCRFTLLPGGKITFVGVTVKGPLKMLLVSRRFVSPRLSTRKPRVMGWFTFVSPKSKAGELS